MSERRFTKGARHGAVRLGILKSEWPAVREKWSWTPVEIESRV